MPQLAYILVSDDPQQQPEGGTAAPAAAATGSTAPAAALPQPPARYTHSLLRGTLQLMGAKPRHSERAACKAFLILQQRAALPPGEALSLAARLVAAPSDRAGVALTRLEFDRLLLDCLEAPEPRPAAAAGAAEQPGEGLQQVAANGVAAPQPLPMSGQQEVDGVQQDAQQQEGHQRVVPPAPPQQQPQAHEQQPTQQQQPQQQHPQPAFTLQDLHVACSLREQRTSVAVLLCGTSGTGEPAGRRLVGVAFAADRCSELHRLAGGPCAAVIATPCPALSCSPS